MHLEQIRGFGIMNTKDKRIQAASFPPFPPHCPPSHPSFPPRAWTNEASRPTECCKANKCRFPASPFPLAGSQLTSLPHRRGPCVYLVSEAGSSGRPPLPHGSLQDLRQGCLFIAFLLSSFCTARRKL
ncbi:hypothetical protein E2C01_048265 [Portunus trituberculatus]|uniref:Uncharacterized protein n=1 Tax=Portunus trituberculatus TaxID=210409 RepID=A0A5B7GCU6_PORTR|nr:hypothetical protein [Portunus trituberculatus]